MDKIRFIYSCLLFLVGFCSQNIGQSIFPQINGDPVFLTEEVFIAGGCFDVENAVVSGGVGAVGTFTNGDEAIGIGSGIILSTGSVLNAYGPNSQTNFTTNFNLNNSDPDLEIMIDNPVIPIHDVAILEFDFTPTSNQVSFEYVFASEEYCDFVNTLYNDVFGFFISGPGINGPFSNGAENIALIPGTADFVAINNVNHLTNSAFYLNNIPVNHPQIDGCPGPYPNNDPVAEDIIEFDGYTLVLTASATVIPCETYHIKLVVGDVTDGQYDSAVFLKANSFEAGETVTIDAIVPSTGTNLTYEGCTDAYFLFERFDSDLESTLTVDFSISPGSTTIAGQDYAPLPTAVIFQPGQTTVQLPVSFFADGLAEGQETLTLEMESACSCYSTSATFIVDDGSLLEAVLDSVRLCEGEEVIMEPQISAGQPPYEFLWSDGTSNPSLINIPESSETIFLEVNDACGRSVTLESFIEIIPKPNVFLDGEITICNQEAEASLEITTEGEPPWLLTYSIDGIWQEPVIIPESPFQLPISESGVYIPELLESVGCSGEVSGAGLVTVSDLDVLVNIENVSCYGQHDGAIELEISGGNPPFTILWDDGVQAEYRSQLSSDNYVVTVIDIGGCSYEQEIIIQEPEVLNLDIIIQNPSCHGTGDGFINLQPSGGTPPYSFQLNDSEFQNEPWFENLTGGDYLVTVFDANGCTYSEQVVVEEPEALEVSVDQMSPACLGMNSGSISVFTLGGTGSFLYRLNGGPFQPESFFDQLEAGEYEMEVADENGCFLIQNVDIQAPLPFEAELITHQPSCSITPDGAIHVMVGEVLGQPDFNLNGGEFQEDPDFYGLSPGNYEVVILDGSGCEVTLFATLDNPGSVEPEISGPTEVCEGDSVELTVTGSFEQVFWNTGEGSNSIMVLESGHYEVTAVDAEGCWGIAGFDLESIPVPDVQIIGNSVLCTDETSFLFLNDDYISHVWSNGMNGDSLLIDQAGNYFVNVEYAPGCWTEATIDVYPNELSPVSIIGSLVFCEEGSTHLFTSNNFNSFSWSNGSTGAGIEVFSPGSYQVTVEDSNGCVSADTVWVEVSDALMPEIQGEPGICHGDSLNLYVEASFEQFLWSTGENEGSVFIHQPGVYSVTVQGGNCIGQDSIEVIQFPEVDVEITGNTSFCYQDFSSLSIIGTYEEYFWSDGTNGPVLNLDQPGSYNVTVSDENGCPGIDSILVEQFLPAMTYIQLDLCAGDTLAFGNHLISSSGVYYDTLFHASANGCDSIIFLEIQFLDPVFDTLHVLIPEGEGHFFGGDFLFESGEYLDTLTSVDSFCDSILVLLLEVVEVPSVYDTLHFITCDSESFDFNGITYVESGVFLDTIFSNSIWEPDTLFVIHVESVISETNHIEYNLCRGDSINLNGQWFWENSVLLDTLLNEYGCDSLVIIDLFFEDLEVKIEQIQPVFCLGDSTAALEALVINSSQEYDLVWNTGDHNVTIENLPAGNYHATASNNFGCQAVDSIQIVQPNSIKASWETQLDCKHPGQAFLNVLTVSGGTPPYVYSLGNNQFQTENWFRVESPSSQILLIEDALGCIGKFDDIEVEQELKVEISLENHWISLGDTLLLEASYNFDPIAVYWQNSSFLSCWDCCETLAFPEETTVFTVSILTRDSCWVDTQITIYVDQRVDVFIPSAFSPNGDGINDHFTVFGGSQIKKVRLLEIFDRWGNLVFRRKDFLPNDELSGWDGRFNRKPTGEGVYVYRTIVETIKGKTLDYSGEIILIRN